MTRGRLWKLAIYLFLLGFILNLLGIVWHVVVSSFAKRWFGKPLPPAFTTDWFAYAWTNFELGHVLFITRIHRARGRVHRARDRISGRLHPGAAQLPRSRSCCCCISCRCSFRR